MTDAYRSVSPQGAGGAPPEGSRRARRMGLRYALPTTLEDLRGPTSGTVMVPGHGDVHLEPTYDLSDPTMVGFLYLRLVRDGTRGEQEQLLDRDTLQGLWPWLDLPDACRSTWEDRFPELAGVSEGPSIAPIAAPSEKTA